MPARRRHVVSEVDGNSSIAISNNVWQGGNTQRYHDVGQTDGLLIENDTKHQDNATPVIMTSRDRTNEFANAIRSMQSRTSATSSAVLQNSRRARQIQSYSNFMMMAKNIGKNIASTYAKLEKLALCKIIDIRAMFNIIF